MPRLGAVRGLGAILAFATVFVFATGLRITNAFDFKAIGPQYKSSRLAAISN